MTNTKKVINVSFKHHVPHDDIYAVLHCDNNVNYLNNNYTAYSHIGQHSDVAASYVLESVDAVLDQYASLLDELRTVYSEYDLIVLGAWLPVTPLPMWNIGMVVRMHKGYEIRRSTNGYYLVYINRELHAFGSIRGAMWKLSHWINYPELLGQYQISRVNGDIA